MPYGPNKHADADALSTLHRPARRLACRRCNRQKLQCRWEEEGDNACIRCRRVNAVCTISTPRRLGRPPQGREAQEHGAGYQQQPRQQDLVDAGSPSGDVSAHLPSPDGWASFPEWTALAATTSSSSSNVVSGLASTDGPPALLGIPQLGDDEGLWSFATGPSSSTPSSIPTASSSLATGLDSGTGHSESLGGAPTQLRQVYQQAIADDQEREAQPPLDHQELCMQKLWGLQRLLYQQLKQVKFITETEDTPTPSSTGIPRVPNAPYPVDQVLQSAQVFIEMLDRFKGHESVATPASAASTTAAGVAWDAGRSSNDDSTAGIETQPSSSSGGGGGGGGVTRSALLELDTPMIFAVLSCYARLIDIYDELFQHFGRLLPSLSWQQPTLQAGFPQLQLGEFQLRDCSSLQVVITVKVLLHALRCVEKTIGVFGQHSAAGGAMRNNGNSRSVDDPDRNKTTDGVFGQFGRDKLAQVMTILEKDGPAGGLGGRPGRIESLRGNIRKVNELLEYA